MKTAYRILAGLIALVVVVQAASIAYATFSLAQAVDGGATINKDSDVGWLGWAIHAIGGQFLIPLLALILLVVSFWARIPKGVMWAGIVLLTVVVQVTLGIVSFSVPGLGWLHGIVALVLFSLAVFTARLAATSAPAEKATKTAPMPDAAA